MTDQAWKKINGKTINYKIDSGETIEALVIADPDVGISIKPMDPNDVPKEYPWRIPPSDPNFFFICTHAKGGSDMFAKWVRILSEKRNLFGPSDLSFGFGDSGGCPFAS